MVEKSFPGVLPEEGFGSDGAGYVHFPFHRDGVPPDEFQLRLFPVLQHPFPGLFLHVRPVRYRQHRVLRLLPKGRRGRGTCCRLR